MPRRREIEIRFVESTHSEEECVRRVARATEILMRIADRIDAAKAVECVKETDACDQRSEPPSHPARGD